MPTKKKTKNSLHPGVDLLINMKGEQQSHFYSNSSYLFMFDYKIFLIWEEYMLNSCFYIFLILRSKVNPVKLPLWPLMTVIKLVLIL